MEDKLGDKTGDKLEEADKASRPVGRQDGRQTQKRRRQHRRRGGKQDGRQAGRRTQIADKADIWGKHWKCKQPTVCENLEDGWGGSRSSKTICVKGFLCKDNSAWLLPWFADAWLYMRQPNFVFRGGRYPFLSHAFGLAKPTNIGLHFAGLCAVALVTIRMLLPVVNEVMNKDHGKPLWKFTFRWICFGLKVDPMIFCKHINLVWKTVVLSLRVISGTLGKHGLWTHWPCCFSNAQMVIVEHPWKTTKPSRVRHTGRRDQKLLLVNVSDFRTGIFIKIQHLQKVCNASNQKSTEYSELHFLVSGLNVSNPMHTNVKASGQDLHSALGEQSWCTKDIMDIPSRSVEVGNPADASWEALLPNMPCGLREATEQTSMLFGPNCKLFDFVWTAENWIIAVLGPWCCASERPGPPQHPLLRSNLESMYLFQTKDGTVSLLCCGWGTLTWDTLLFEVWHPHTTIQDFT